ncbi:MAG: PEP-CTERM sorting domain-containing protein [Planctomycetia bacterium]|nr:PEP-CTERM sorting domain-containing protein [Planctomycetia bacterium]
MKTTLQSLSIHATLICAALLLWGGGPFGHAQELEEIPDDVLQLGETNGNLEVTPAYSEIRTTTDTTTVSKFHFSGSSAPTGTVQFTGSAGAVINVGTMNVEQSFTNNIDLNGVSLNIQNMTNDTYGKINSSEPTKTTPTYSITNTSETLSTVSITRSEYSRLHANYQDANRASINGNIQLVINPVTSYPSTSDVPVEYRNMYDRVYLWGDNTYTGGTVVTGYEYEGVYNTTLHAVASSLGTGDLTLRNFATLMNAKQSDTYTNNIILDGGGILRVGGEYTMVFTGVISGTGDLYLNYNEANGGDIVLAGNNTFDGDTHLCGYLSTTQQGKGSDYTVHVQNDNAFSSGDIIFNSAADERQYQVTLELDNPGGTRIITNNIDVSFQKATFTKSEGTLEAIIGGQLTGESVSMVVNNGVNFQIDLDNWVLPSDGEFLYMWDMKGTLEFQSATTFSILTSDLSQYSGQRIYLAQTDNVIGKENIQIDLSQAEGDGEWEQGVDPEKGFYIQFTANPPKPVETPEPASGLLMLLGLLLAFRRRQPK